MNKKKQKINSKKKMSKKKMKKKKKQREKNKKREKKKQREKKKFREKKQIQSLDHKLNNPQNIQQKEKKLNLKIYNSNNSILKRYYLIKILIQYQGLFQKMKNMRDLNIAKQLKTNSKLSQTNQINW
ncbi:hypothetical protein TTHERM_000876896 (macronuclear) [Tetrahymena thermophila SB210]|uniref:Transmembrane protein n=1 Tax=Tetrahymena thermophila (strain SB210) TaxID=312017 RepID=W7X4W1_TETTS|nr:hypothetical protein TTHERM_000876896 [Tetrahymena thermophila SB210]EWS74365.1 hypothetical protein TTHERM_000876896 [Tetrahymena thermophila SB210]|eukprot:XP_012653094.1 hypothetical protein TTHERM_000876896 [Tetrahymena thermophila SB210]